jgi:hypothetical protein
MEKEIEYQISSSVNEGILEIILAGEVTGDTLKELRSEILALIKGNGVKNVLLDVRNIKGSMGYGQMYARVREYPLDLHTINIAFIDTSEKMDNESFYEVTGRNIGLNWKWFTETGAARDWLESKKQK